MSPFARPLLDLLGLAAPRGALTELLLREMTTHIIASSRDAQVQ